MIDPIFVLIGLCFLIAVLAAFLLGSARGYAQGRADYQVITNPWQAQGVYSGQKKPGEYDL